MTDKANHIVWAAEVVVVFQRRCRTGDQHAIADLICDLGHLAEERGLDFLRAVGRGIGHWYVEQHAVRRPLDRLSAARAGRGRAGAAPGLPRRSTRVIVKAFGIRVSVKPQRITPAACSSFKAYPVRRPARFCGAETHQPWRR